VVDDFLYHADTSLLDRGKVKKFFIPQEMRIVLMRLPPWISAANPPYATSLLSGVWVLKKLILPPT